MTKCWRDLCRERLFRRYGRRFSGRSSLQRPGGKLRCGKTFHTLLCAASRECAPRLQLIPAELQQRDDDYDPSRVNEIHEKNLTGKVHGTLKDNRKKSNFRAGGKGRKKQ